MPGARAAPVKHCRALNTSPSFTFCIAAAARCSRQPTILPTDRKRTCQTWQVRLCPLSVVPRVSSATKKAIKQTTSTLSSPFVRAITASCLACNATLAACKKSASQMERTRLQHCEAASRKPPPNQLRPTLPNSDFSGQDKALPELASFGDTTRVHRFPNSVCTCLKNHLDVCRFQRSDLCIPLRCCGQDTFLDTPVEMGTPYGLGKPLSVNPLGQTFVGLYAPHVHGLVQCVPTCHDCNAPTGVHATHWDGNVTD